VRAKVSVLGEASDALIFLQKNGLASEETLIRSPLLSRRKTFYARICELTGTGPIKGESYLAQWLKRRRRRHRHARHRDHQAPLFPQPAERVILLCECQGLNKTREVRYIRVTASAIKEGACRSKRLNAAWKKADSKA